MFLFPKTTFSGKTKTKKATTKKVNIVDHLNLQHFTLFVPHLCVHCDKIVENSILSECNSISLVPYRYHHASSQVMILYLVASRLYFIFGGLLGDFKFQLRKHCVFNLDYFKVSIS